MAFFHSRPYLREDLVQDLGETEDTTRIVQRFLLGRGQPSDLAAIKTTIQTWAGIKGRVALEKDMEVRERGVIDEDEWSSIDALMDRMHNLDHLVGMIDKAMPVADDVDGTTFGASLPSEGEDVGGVDHRSSSLLQAAQGIVNVKHTIAPRSLSCPRY